MVINKILIMDIVFKAKTYRNYFTLSQASCDCSVVVTLESRKTRAKRKKG